MLFRLIENFLLGFTITALPGAVLFETIRRALSRRGTVVPFLTGNFTGMLIVILVIFFGVSTLFSGRDVSMIFYVLSGGVLVCIGLASMFSRPRNAPQPVGSPSKSYYVAFATGIALAVANPASIAFWIVVTGKLLQENSMPAALMGSMSIVAGAFAFFVILLLVAGKIKTKIHERYLLWLARGFGFVVFAYGLAILSNVIR